MKPTKETYRVAILFAQYHDFDDVIYETIYKNCVVYYATSAALEGTYSGYPHFILVNKDLDCRFSTPDEALDIMAKSDEK